MNEQTTQEQLAECIGGAHDYRCVWCGRTSDLAANLECSRDAERIIGERLKVAREILAECRFFIASADLLRRIDVAIAQGKRQ